VLKGCYEFRFDQNMFDSPEKPQSCQNAVAGEQSAKATFGAVFIYKYFSFKAWQISSI